MDGRGEPNAEVLQFLCSTSVFSCLNECAGRSLAADCRFRRVAKGEIIFFYSDPAEAAYLVRSGIVFLVLNSPDGREMVIEEVRAGELFGEMELLTGEPRVAGAVAHSHCELLIIPSAALLQALDEEPRLVRRVLDRAANRLQSSIQRQMALVFMDAHARLARNLLALDEEQRNVGFVTVSQEELASEAGLIRQTVAKALGEWRRNGWLLTGRGRIVVLNRKALARVAEAGLE